MLEKIYSNLGCGCYYTAQNKDWILCDEHAKQKGADTYRFDQVGYLKQKVQYQKAKSEKMERLGHTGKHPVSPEPYLSIRSALEVQTFRAPHHRSIAPTGKYNLKGIRRDRELPVPPPRKNDLNSPRHYYWLYVLYLQDDKYYVGMTAKSNPLYRIDNHGDILGALWTYDHKPIKILEIIDVGKVTREQAERMENDLTLVYMNHHSRHKVRGGYMATPGWLYFRAKNPTALRPLTFESALGIMSKIIFVGFVAWLIVSGV